MKRLNDLLHVLRNPYGHSEERVREARLQAADMLEAAYNHAEPWVCPVCVRQTLEVDAYCPTCLGFGRLWPAGDPRPKELKRAHRDFAERLISGAYEGVLAVALERGPTGRASWTGCHLYASVGQPPSGSEAWEASEHLVSLGHWLERHGRVKRS